METIKWVFSGIGALAMAWLARVIRTVVKRSRRSSKTQVPVASAVPTKSELGTIPNAGSQLQQWFHRTERIRIGDFSKFERDGQSIRIEVRDIRTARLPHGLSVEQQQESVAELAIDLGGGLVYGGDETIETSVNTYLVPSTQSEEALRSIYNFHSHEKYFSFIRITISHINAHERWVDVDVIAFSIRAVSSRAA